MWSIFPLKSCGVHRQPPSYFRNRFLSKIPPFPAPSFPVWGWLMRGVGRQKVKVCSLRMTSSNKSHAGHIASFFSVFSFSVSFFRLQGGYKYQTQKKKSNRETAAADNFFSGQQKFLLLVLHLFRSKNHLFPWWNVTKIRNVSNSTGSFIPAIHSPVTFPSSWNDYRLVFFALLR